MDTEQLSDLQRVNNDELTGLYREASIAVLRAQTNQTDDERWPVAAQRLCAFLSFVQADGTLWGGLGQAVQAAALSNEDLQITWERLDEFTEAEFALLQRAGLDDATAGRIVFDLREGLRSGNTPGAHDIRELRDTIRTVQGYLCEGDFAAFGEPERKARNLVNSNAILAGGGGLVATVTNAIAPLLPPFIAGSVVGGIAAAIGGFRAFTRRRRH